MSGVRPFLKSKIESKEDKERWEADFKEMCDEDESMYPDNDPMGMGYDTSQEYFEEIENRKMELMKVAKDSGYRVWMGKLEPDLNI